MAGPEAEAFAYLLRRAFDGGEHAFLRNLDGVSEAEWRALPPARMRGRAIGDIAWHAAAAKHLYWDAAFGSATLTGDITEERPWDHGRSMADVLAYARDGQAKLLAALAGLEDGAMAHPARAHWGEMLPVRRVFASMIEHDLYHAGEINHIRAMLRDEDHWPGES